MTTAAVASGRYPPTAPPTTIWRWAPTAPLLTSSRRHHLDHRQRGRGLPHRGGGSRLIAWATAAPGYRELAGTTWTAASGASGNMRGMIRAQNIYTAVGAAGPATAY